MNDKELETPQPVITHLDLISKASKLNYSINQTATIVHSSFPDLNKKDIEDLLSSPASEEYEAYQSGKDIRLFDIENALYRAATSGDVDAQQALLKLQVDKDVSQAINANFFSAEDTECNQ